MPLPIATKSCCKKKGGPSRYIGTTEWQYIGLYVDTSYSENMKKFYFKFTVTATQAVPLQCALSFEALKFSFGLHWNRRM